MHRREVGVAGLVAMDDAERDAGARDLRALLADVLAVLVVHRGEEVVEVAPAGDVAPVVLHVDARAASSSPKARRPPASAWKLTCADDSPARARQRDRRGQQRAPCAVVARQQARAGHRRVGHRAQPLREVVAAVLRIGMRPGVVEHELAVRIGLEVAGRRGDQRVAVPSVRWCGVQPYASAQAAVLLQPGQEGMRDERIASVVQRIPLRRRESSDSAPMTRA